MINWTPTRSKYNNRKTEIMGHKFDSQKEAMHYLHLRQKIGCLEKPSDRVKKIELQPEFELIPGWTETWNVINPKTGRLNKKTKRHRSVKYIADFRVTYQDGHVEIHDVKGMLTKVYKIKKAILLYKMREDKNFIFKEI